MSPLGAARSVIINSGGVSYEGTDHSAYLDYHIALMPMTSSVQTVTTSNHESNTVNVNGVNLNMEVMEADPDVNASTNYGSNTADTYGLMTRFTGDVDIASGATITPNTRKRGWYIYTSGNFVNNGTISMTARGASATGQTVHIDGVKNIPATGAAKDTAGSNTNGTTGGGGTASSNNYPGPGGSGTSFSGGAGGGTGGNGVTGGSGSNNGGAGGAQNSGYGAGASFGGGAGNPGGQKNQGNSDGTGGLLIIICGGDFTNNGNIQANGKSGATGWAWHRGGGSGGGSINIARGGNYTNNGTIQANGGNYAAAGGIRNWSYTPSY